MALITATIARRSSPHFSMPTQTFACATSGGGRRCAAVARLLIARGSLYVNAGTMADREAFLAVGGRIPDVPTCEMGHRDPARFQFAAWWPKIAHGRTPAGPSCW